MEESIAITLKVPSSKRNTTRQLPETRMLHRPARSPLRGCSRKPGASSRSCSAHSPLCHPEAARRFGDCLRKCAAGAAAQAPLGLNADCTTAFIARQLERSGSVIGTPFGAWFSHPNTDGVPITETALPTKGLPPDYDGRRHPRPYALGRTGMVRYWAFDAKGCGR